VNKKILEINIQSNDHKTNKFKYTIDELEQVLKECEPIRTLCNTSIDLKFESIPDNKYIDILIDLLRYSCTCFDVCLKYPNSYQYKRLLQIKSDRLTLSSFDVIPACVSQFNFIEINCKGHELADFAAKGCAFSANISLYISGYTNNQLPVLFTLLSKFKSNVTVWFKERVDKYVSGWYNLMCCTSEQLVIKSSQFIPKKNTDASIQALCAFKRVHFDIDDIHKHTKEMKRLLNQSFELVLNTWCPEFISNQLYVYRDGIAFKFIYTDSQLLNSDSYIITYCHTMDSIHHILQSKPKNVYISMISTNLVSKMQLYPDTNYHVTCHTETDVQMLLPVFNRIVPMMTIQVHPNILAPYRIFSINSHRIKNANEIIAVNAKDKFVIMMCKDSFLYQYLSQDMIVTIYSFVNK